MQQYIANDDISKQILNSANLLKNVNVHTLIVGSSGVGKKSLAKYIVDDERVHDAKDLQKDIHENVINIQNKSIVVDKINELTNIELFLNWLEENAIRLIAISDTIILNNKLESIFSVTLEVENLEKRPLDTKELINKFSDEASKILDFPKLDSSKLMVNLTKNAHSLRKSIYFSYLFETISEDEILSFLERYLGENLEGENSYKDLLYLFEVPLLKASTKKYKSQVQVAKHLGLNRITLRKKLDIHKELLWVN